MAAHALEILAVVEGGRVDLFIATSWRRSSARVHDRIRCTYLVVQYLEKKLGNLNPTSDLCFFQVFFFSHDGTDGTTHRCSDSPRIFPRHRQAHGARRRRPGALLGWGEALKKPAGRSRHLCGRAGRWRARGGQKQPKKRRKRPRRQIRGLTRKSQRPPTANTTPGPAPAARTPKK